MSYKRVKPILQTALLLIAITLLFGMESGAANGLVEARVPAGLQGQAAPEAQAFEGRIIPQRWVNLSFLTGGRVAEIRVEEGQRVQAGTALARLEGAEAGDAQVAAARLEWLAAGQALDALHRNAAVALAEAEYNLAEAREVQEQANWRVRRLNEPVSPLRVEQAYANMQLAERGLEKVRRDLEKAEKLWNDRRDPAWYVLSRREFRLNLALLSQQVAQAERKYIDAVEKYNDLLEPVDKIDLQQAEVDLQVADAQVEQAAQERDKRLDGPDPGDLAQAQARLSAAEKALQAAETALAQLELKAPFDGNVVSVSGRESQWANPGEVLFVLADLTGWRIELVEIEESNVTRLEIGDPVTIRLVALPDQELTGRVESIDWIYQEKDGEILYSAEVSLSGYPSGLRWGMTARVESGAVPDLGNSSDG